MPKIVIQNKQKIAFIKDSSRIIDHYYCNDGTLYFKYEISFSILDNSIQNNALFIGLSTSNPIEKQKNMFEKSVNQTTQTALDNIKLFDSKRINTMSKKQNAAFFTKSVNSIDIKNRKIIFDVAHTNSSYKNVYAFFYLQKANVQETLAITTIEQSELIKNYELPYNDFVVNSSLVKNNVRRIAIHTNDKRIKKFIIISNNQYGANSSQSDEQGTLQEVIVKNNDAFIDVFEKPNISKQYRIIPVSFLNETIVCQYNSFDVNNNMLNNADCIIYSTGVAADNATICVASLPVNSITAYLVRKNLTQKETKYSIIDSKSTRSAETIQFTDFTLNVYNTYDYKVIFEMLDGTKMTSSSNCIITPQLLNEIAHLAVTQTNEQINETTATRTFETSVSYTQESSTSKTLNDLKLLGIDNLFQNEIKNLSTQLDPLIGVFVTKIDLKSNTEERVGIFNKGEIKLTDTTLYDIVYRFEICLKTVPDMVEEIVTSSDFVNYNNSNPLTVSSNVLTMSVFQNTDNFTQKFYSKSMQEKGALKYGKTKNSSMTGIESGRTNIFQTVFLKNKQLQPTVTSTKVIDKKDGIILTWNAIDVDNVNRFEIFTNKGKVANCIAAKNIDTYYATLKEKFGEKFLLKTMMKNGGVLIKEFEYEA